MITEERLTALVEKGLNVINTHRTNLLMCLGLLPLMIQILRHGGLRF